MSSCLVLSDRNVHEILINLSRDEIYTFLNHVGDSLKAFSTAGERSHQPGPAVIQRDGRKNLFRLFTSPSGVGVKIIVDTWQDTASEQDSSKDEKEVKEKPPMGLHGVLTLCNQYGLPIGFMNAEEVTGYRTSLSAMLLYAKRKVTTNIVVFGAGTQALWHIRLALALKGDFIQQITVVNRSAERTTTLFEQIKKENEERWKAEVDLTSILTGDEEKLKAALGAADAVFCTTPSKKILFPANYLIGKKSGCYVSAIGSWTRGMIELDPEILKVAGQGDGEGSIVVVDDREECVTSVEEVIQSGLEEDRITEVGEVLDLLSGAASQSQEKTRNCLETGFVVYKSVGVSLTDLSAGQALLDLAKKQNRGLSLSEF